MNIFEILVQEANKRGLNYLVIGGHAVITHGFARNTFDLDLIVHRIDREKWTDLWIKYGYLIKNETPTFLQLVSIDKQFPDVDLMFVTEDTYAKMEVESKPAPPWGMGSKVVSLAHLLALKCHALKHGHEDRFAKDEGDVIQLFKINHLDPQENQWRELILKHGSPELYEKICQKIRK